MFYIRQSGDAVNLIRLNKIRIIRSEQDPTETRIVGIFPDGEIVNLFPASDDRWANVNICLNEFDRIMTMIPRDVIGGNDVQRNNT